MRLWNSIVDFAIRIAGHKQRFSDWPADGSPHHLNEYLSREPGTPTMAEVQAENAALKSELRLQHKRYETLLRTFTDYCAKQPPATEDHPAPFNPPPIGNRPF